MTMPFGCFKGRPVGSLPREYLKWLWENVDLRGHLKEAVFSALGESTGEQPSARQLPLFLAIRVRRDDVPMIREVFDLGYRAVARTLYPSVGGDPGAMVRLNALMDSVRSQLREVGVSK